KDGRFFYNNAVNNITKVSVTNVYSKPVAVERRSKPALTVGRVVRQRRLRLHNSRPNGKIILQRRRSRGGMRKRLQRIRHFLCCEIMAPPRLRRRHTPGCLKVQESWPPVLTSRS